MKTVVGLFDNYNEARSAMTDLISAGFNQNDISLVASNANNRFANSDGTIDDTHDDDDAQPAKDGAGTGAVVGTLVGGGAMLAASAGLLLIPGVGPVLAAGPLIATLTGAGVGALAGAAVGGLVGGLVGAGVPEHEAGYYAEGVRRGGTLLAVRSEDNLADNAADILSRHGAVDIDERAEYYRTTGYTGYNADAPHYNNEDIERDRAGYAANYATASTPNMANTAATAGTVGTTGAAYTGSTTTNNANFGTVHSADIDRGGEVAIPVVEEELAVGKRQVQKGGVRVYSHVTETPVTESVNLHEEHVNVQRRAVDRPITNADSAFREGSLEVTEMAEVPVVAKEARVVEEVLINKQATDRVETVSDTVRRTDVDVQQIPGQTVTTGTTTTGGSHINRDLNDGTTDTRSLAEKAADAMTGDRVDDKTGNIVR